MEDQPARDWKGGKGKHCHKSDSRSEELWQMRNATERRKHTKLEVLSYLESFYSKAEFEGKKLQSLLTHVTFFICGKEKCWSDMITIITASIQKDMMVFHPEFSSVNHCSTSQELMPQAAATNALSHTANAPYRLSRHITDAGALKYHTALLLQGICV